MAGTWQPLTHQPMFNTSTMILLTDGRIMVQEEATAHWHALSPDPSGSYIDGQWSTLSDMSIWRRYYASGVLRDGRVLVCGGEQNGSGQEDTNRGEIYDPTKDTWTAIKLPPWPQVGDAACCVLPDGRIMIGALLSGDCLIYDPATDSWSPTKGPQPGRTNEETWILLPDETIVTVQCFAPYHGLKFVIGTGKWQDEGPLPVQVVDQTMSEIGPAMLTYDGRVIFFGAANSGGSGKTAVYTPAGVPSGTGTWAAGPDIPTVRGKVIVCNDCPATLLPNGRVLFTAANFVDNGWGFPVLFFEYDPASSTIAPAPIPPNNGTFPYPSDPGVYWSRLMLLPTGQVLFSASSGDVQCYTPDGSPRECWRPTICSITPHGTAQKTEYFILRGTQLNGLSQANIYGDDCYPATNYPLVRLTDLVSHKVYYSRSYDFSTMGVATGPSIQSTRFDPSNLPAGTFDVTVIANGISSRAFLLSYAGAGAPGAADPYIANLGAQVRSLQNAVQRLGRLHQTKGEVDSSQIAKPTKDPEDSDNA
jgi:Kelch motif